MCSAFKGEQCSKIFVLLFASQCGKIFLAKTRSKYDNEKLLVFEGMCVRQGTDHPPPPFFLTTSVTSAFTSHCTACTVLVLCGYLMCEDAVNIVTVVSRNALQGQGNTMQTPRYRVLCVHSIFFCGTYHTHVVGTECNKFSQTQLPEQ